MVTKSSASRRHVRGFTLVEIIIAIVLLGIVSSVVAVYIVSPIKAYFSTANRAQLTDTADGAMRRISRDVASALPNSLRSTSPTNSTSCFEFIPTLAGGRYRVQSGATGNGDILDFSIADNSFDVLGHINLGNLPSGSHQVAIYNLGIEGADAYAGLNTSAISTATATNITLSAPKQFLFASPSNAFAVIPNTSVVYSCSGTSLLRSTRAISSTPMASCPSTGTALATNVSSCAFFYLPAVNERNGILTLSLALTLDGETVSLFNQVMVNNVP